MHEKKVAEDSCEGTYSQSGEVSRQQAVAADAAGCGATAPQTGGITDLAKVALAEFFGEGDPSNTPPQETTRGGEDYLAVSLYIDHGDFAALSRRLDDAREAAASATIGGDEIQLGDVRFIVSAGGTRQGDRSKGSWMRWKLRSESGITLLLMDREKSHRTLPNAAIQAASLPLMQHGTDAVWGMCQHVLDAIGARLVANKVSRVDGCIDLAGIAVDEFMNALRAGYCARRARCRAEFDNGVPVSWHFQGSRPTGFTIGRHPLQLRIYDKLTESANSPEKLALLVANRWGYMPACATRVEFELWRARLKKFGVDSYEDWVCKRGAIFEELTSTWFRLCDGPVDHQHADRAATLPAWRQVQEYFAAWSGSSGTVTLTPLSGLGIDTSRQMAQVLGQFVGNFARTGKDIRDNEQFMREAEFGLRQSIGDRDMAEAVRRKALELGLC